ncbi:fatty acid desaturase [Ruegeria lacuscaerulensis]|uniref:fatty acid desaturase n=1 Tax=Ruegeria lacuscaerulensis TaxID=55218 RepID=UPI00147B3BCB|nr:fatty acid desaturase [Ruegeria lacuscaerulensis]
MITNAKTSNIHLDKKALKALMRRSDRPGLIYLGSWLGLLAFCATLVMLSVGTWWMVPTLLIYSGIFAVPAYALSHECAHGTAFRTRWLNEAVFWLTSLLYYEEPLHRRYSHASHHTHTWIEGEDNQMPFAPIPLTFSGWVEEILGLGLYCHQTKMFVSHSLGVFSDDVKRVTPESELPRMQRNTQICVAIYLGFAAISIWFGWLWPLWLIVIPRVLGGPIMNAFILMQHVEMAENQPNIVQSTRSFRTNWFFQFLYFNMNNHIEHHLYPTVPFHALPKLSEALTDQLPKPDAGFLNTHWEVLKITVRRSLGHDDRSDKIRQAFPDTPAGETNDTAMA